ncbi:MAG: hypothetical protein HY298_04465 [Verrucomicrobia bacterium]|nr:hypothetical protein [Verrucomicrobiota bacterium]
MNDPQSHATHLPRRTFLKEIAVGTSALATSGPLLAADLFSPSAKEARLPYRGPNVVIIRFGGGARRRETIDPEQTYSPFLCHELTRRGTFFKGMEIATIKDINTSHGEGTLYIITGKYDKFRDVQGKFLGARFESTVPTVFEYFRKAYDVPDHQALIVNGEDRADEEFYNFSNHHLFGAHFRSNTLSLRRFKTYLLRQQIAAGQWDGKQLKQKQRDLAKLEAIDYRATEKNGQGPELTQFWERWRKYYGETGLVNPRGDRLLTELTVRALKELRPKLIMVNYQDCDYVHWGNVNHYTRAIAIMDEGVRQIVATVEADAEYRDNTIFVVVPDCGRDNNPLAAVPCQHHFNTRSAHEIFALIFGPGIAKGAVVDHRVDQIQVAATIGKLMNFKTEFTEGPVLAEAIA